MNHDDAGFDICTNHVVRAAMFIAGGRGGKQESEEQEDDTGQQCQPSSRVLS